MRANTLNEQQLRAMAALKDTDAMTVLVSELEQIDLQLMTCSDDVQTRWLQGRKQMLFEITEIVKTARDYLEKKRTPQRKEVFGNSF